MSKKNVVHTSDTVADEALKDKNFNWSELVQLRKETLETIMSQQLLVKEVSHNYQLAIAKDKKTEELVIGLIKSLEDLIKETIAISVTHATETKEINGVTIPTKFKSGEIVDDDENMEYISTGAQYITIQEKTAHLSGTAYLDVFVQLKLANTKITTEDDKKLNEIKGMLDGKE